MMGRTGTLAVLLFCIGAAILIESVHARTHTDFSASTYYDSGETVSTIVPPKDEPSTTSEPKERYPHGHYPGQTHVWNATTEKYDAVNEKDVPPEGRYPRGHYPGQTHVWNPATEKYETVNETKDVPPDGRYPHGHYPGQTHVWNATTEKYYTVNETKDVAPEGRYPRGHYPGQTHGWNATTETYYTVNETKDVPPEGRYPRGHYPGQTHVWNPSTEKYETVNETKDVPPEGRYPRGHYPGQTHVWNPATQKYDEVAQSENNITTSAPKNRYEHGYYGKAVFNYSASDTLDVVKSPETSSYTKDSDKDTEAGTQNRYPAGYHNGHGSNPAVYKQYSSSEPDVESTTFDPVEGRYKYGYHPKSSYAGSSRKSTTTSFSAKDPAAVSINGERYPFGYHSESKPVTYSSSSTGGFSTLPFPSSGVPFVPNGAGCRTAYWADHPASWPSFLSVKSTVEDAFGEKAAAVYGQTTILQALFKYDSDPFSEILRSGCTALLNSYTRGEYPIPYIKVIAEFNAALVSKEAATKQALMFETANVESISDGNACT